MFEASQIILVTGASSGIGHAVALECARKGATVIAQGRDEERLEKARAESAAPERWISVIRDFSVDMEQIPQWLSGIATKHGKLYGLAHCAGSAIMDSIRTYDLETARKFFDLNFHAPMLLAKAFTDRRVSQKGGAMVFLSSVAAVYPEKGHLLYGAAKSALTCAVKCISQETASRGLRVNCIAPGIVDTPMEEAAEAYMGPSYREEQVKHYPLGFGRPRDVAALAAFLLSGEAAWITGQNYIMSGGRY